MAEFNFTKYIDKDPPLEADQKSTTDYLAYLKEQINFLFHNWTRRFTSDTNRISSVETAVSPLMNGRAQLTDEGMSFKNSSGTQTASYPATGLKYQDLVLNGDFNSSSYDLDNATETGMYTYTSSAANTPLNAGGMLLVARNSSTFITQVAFSNYSTASGNYIYTRRCYNGTWTAWTRIVN